ncbi:predicted protein [Histoplasma capsulatum var. duboisii H88]|uniref:Predicted protein n=1 Tax=Ajellomyces capsulatus (strain H88) TaxID=544711 RepID=F0U500_AJEC8|nr:predicted protein [Histoplasma capsulatum var. duboisii H88]
MPKMMIRDADRWKLVAQSPSYCQTTHSELRCNVWLSVTIAAEAGQEDLVWSMKKKLKVGATIGVKLSSLPSLHDKRSLKERSLTDRTSDVRRIERFKGNNSQVSPSAQSSFISDVSPWEEFPKDGLFNKNDKFNLPVFDNSRIGR